MPQGRGPRRRTHAPRSSPRTSRAAEGSTPRPRRIRSSTSEQRPDSRRLHSRRAIASASEAVRSSGATTPDLAKLAASARLGGPAEGGTLTPRSTRSGCGDRAGGRKSGPSRPLARRRRIAPAICRTCQGRVANSWARPAGVSGQSAAPRCSGVTARTRASSAIRTAASRSTSPRMVRIQAPTARTEIPGDSPGARAPIWPAGELSRRGASFSQRPRRSVPLSSR